MALDPQYKDQQEVWLHDNTVMTKFKRINRFINGGVKYVPWSELSYTTTRLPMLAADRYRFCSSLLPVLISFDGRFM